MSFLNFEDLNAYQPRVAQMLLNSFKKARLSHAYIFEGPRGTKKLDAAFLFAKRILCSNPTLDQNPCGKCHNCQRIDKDVHPNVFLIKPEGEYIKKDQIKQMIGELAKTAVEEGPRVYILDEAQRLRSEAANALLKTLEEPGLDIYAIMITDSFDALLKTIVSRAQVMHFSPIDKALIRAHLIEKKVPECLAVVIPEYTNNYEEAIKISESEEMMAIFKLIPELYGMAYEPDKSMILRFREIRDSIFVDTEKTDFFLTLMILYQKDLLNCKLRHNTQIVWTPDIEQIEKLAKGVSQQTIEENLEKMLTLKTRLKFNIIDSLAFDNLLMNLERGFNHAI
ncbi:MAG: DNA polymerase III subunit delta' [Candidatus Izemoplasmatales bacterium]|jgi:DNA polymerase-3 subunit delta'|nr:DNA polymerase III subunit delta' [Candidatus Izemoplasmatales bacterium]MDD3865595.1 DNA polymerase III subunit delta' [Candidatus Izemoplasmatales bacterium]